MSANPALPRVPFEAALLPWRLEAAAWVADVAPWAPTASWAKGTAPPPGTSLGYLEVLDALAAENSAQKVNLFEDFTGRLDIGGLLGSAETAMYLYDVKPGDSFPYHYEYVEEWLLVLDGAVAVRTPRGERELQRGDLVRYPPGAEGAHQITNRSETMARVLLFSKAAVPAVAVYPDTDTIGVWPDDDTEYYFKRDTAVSRDGEEGGE
jgi:uncharacterized cupin superfamily protein